MELKNLTIRIEGNRAVIKTEDATGTKQEKYADFETIHKLFLNEVLTDTGFLPSLINEDGIISIKRLATQGNKGAMIIEGLNLKKTIKYGDTTYEDVYLPNLYLGLRFNKTPDFKITRSFLLGSTEQIFDNGDLYQMPFPNLYSGEKGQICWGGSNATQKYTDEKQLIFLIDDFFSNKFNNDLYHYEMPFTAAIEKLQKKESMIYKKACSFDEFSRLVFNNL